MPKITKRFVENIIPHAEKTQKYWDSELKGFGIVVLPSGRRTYCIQYRNQQRILKRFKIGTHPQITAEEARTWAKKYLSSTIHGSDPAEKKKENRDIPTMKHLIQDYLEHHGCKKRLRSLLEDKKLIKNILLPFLGNKIVAHISRREIEVVHLQLKNTPYQANRFLALLSKMLSLAVAWGWRENNPVKGIERYQELKRERWLNDEELQRLWSVLDQYNNHIAAYAVKLLLLTGARKNELLKASWDQFDFQKGVWIKPAHSTKQKRIEYLPLSDKAIESLNALKNIISSNSNYLFPNKTNEKPLRDIKVFWEKIIKEASIKNARIHDLRHTHASHLVSSCPAPN